MICIDPPALDDLTLSQYADGEAEQQTIDHVAACEFCRANATQLAETQQSLQAMLFRSTCPAPEDLRDLYFSLLPRSQDNFVALHIASCPHCARELSLLKTYMPDPLLDRLADPIADPLTSAPTLLGKLQLWVAELVQPGSAAQPSFGGIRGADQSVQTFQIDAGQNSEGQIGIDVQPNEQHPDSLMIKGLITGIELTGLSVHLWQADQLIASAPVDELLGDFVVAQLAPGTYELLVHGPDLIIRISNLLIEQ